MMEPGDCILAVPFGIEPTPENLGGKLSMHGIFLQQREDGGIMMRTVEGLRIGWTTSPPTYVALIDLPEDEGHELAKVRWTLIKARTDVVDDKRKRESEPTRYVLRRRR